MGGKEFSAQFDVLYNNIASDMAPGLNEYEKCIVLTKAQNELLKNDLLPQSNPKQAGFDANPKRQTDYSYLIRSIGLALSADSMSNTGPANIYDPRGLMATFPSDIFILLNEDLWFMLKTPGAYGQSPEYTTAFHRNVVPISYQEYSTLMKKPYKEPAKDEAWRLMVNSSNNNNIVEVIISRDDLSWINTSVIGVDRIVQYRLRYIHKPKPIIIAPLTPYNMTIDGHDGGVSDTSYTVDSDGYITNPCELDSSLHEEIVQRAVEIAKSSWEGNLQSTVQLGQRSE